MKNNIFKRINKKDIKKNKEKFSVGDLVKYKKGIFEEHTKTIFIITKQKNNSGHYEMMDVSFKFASPQYGFYPHDLCIQKVKTK